LRTRPFQRLGRALGNGSEGVPPSNFHGRDARAPFEKPPCRPFRFRQQRVAMAETRQRIQQWIIRLSFDLQCLGLSEAFQPFGPPACLVQGAG
jgi:hypothetical protein